MEIWPSCFCTVFPNFKFQAVNGYKHIMYLMLIAYNFIGKIYNNLIFEKIFKAMLNISLLRFKKSLLIAVLLFGGITLALWQKIGDKDNEGNNHRG